MILSVRDSGGPYGRGLLPPPCAPPSRDQHHGQGLGRAAVRGEAGRAESLRGRKWKCLPPGEPATGVFPEEFLSTHPQGSRGPPEG